MKSDAHFDLQHLIAYRAGELSPVEAEELQDHLVDCPTCGEEMLDLAAWNEALETPDSPALERRRRQSFEALQQRIHEQSVSAPVGQAAEVGAWSATWRRSGRWLALAAGLVVVVGLVVQFVGTWSQLGEREAELARAQALVARLEQDLAEEEGERLRSAGGLATAQAQVEELEQRLAQIAQGEHGGSRVEGIVRPLFTLRSATNPAAPLSGAIVHQLVASPPESSVKIRLDLTALAHLPELNFKLVDHGGRLRWQENQASLRLHGDLGSLLSFKGLVPGRYYLRVSGQDPGRFLMEVIFEVSHADGG